MRVISLDFFSVAVTAIGFVITVISWFMPSGLNLLERCMIIICVILFAALIVLIRYVQKLKKNIKELELCKSVLEKDKERAIKSRDYWIRTAKNQQQKLQFFIFGWEKMRSTIFSHTLNIKELKFKDILNNFELIEQSIIENGGFEDD